MTFIDRATGPENVEQISARRRRIVEAVTLGAGPIRSAETAGEAIARFERMANEDVYGPPGRLGLENWAMSIAGSMLVQAALRREETRGVHLRTDFPDRDPALDGVHLQF